MSVDNRLAALSNEENLGIGEMDETFIKTLKEAALEVRGTNEKKKDIK